MTKETWLEMNKTIKICALFLGITLFVAADTFAQWGHRGRSRGGYYGRNYGYGSVYRSRPNVSIGIGGVFGGYYPRRYGYGYGYGRPRVGVSVGLNFPGVGVYINTLPMGYRRFFFGGVPYYYYNDMYYRQLDRGGYETVSPPIGSTVRRLPSGVREREIDGEVYYELGGTYYREDIDQDGKRVYIVVGTDGKLDTDEAEKRSYENNDPVYQDGNDRSYNQKPGNADVVVRNGNQSAENDSYSVKPQVGDRFEQLPKDSKAIAVDGERQYVSASGTYYKEVTESGKTVYEVVRTK